MKKIFAIILVTVLSCIIFVGCKSNSTSEESKINSLDKIKKEGVLKVGLNDTYPPMEFRDEKQNIVGFDVDLGKEIAKKLGVKCEIKTNDWKGIILSLKAKQYDMILSSMSITEKRKKEINFSKPYLNGGQEIVVKKDSKDINDSKDLSGKIIGCQIGTTGEKSADKIEGIKELKKYDGVTEAFSDLKIGRLDAVIADGKVAAYYLKKEKDKLKLLDIKLTDEPVGIGFRKEDKELKESVQKALDDLKKEGIMSKLSEKWFGYDIYK